MQFQKGSLIQTISAMMVIGLHVVLLAHFKPYKKVRDGAIALFVYAMLQCCFFGMLLLSAKNALPADHFLLAGIQNSTVTFVLIVSVLSVLSVTVVVALDEFRAATSQPLLQHSKTKQPVVFERYSDPSRFHLFLSHAWSTGQDQVLSIKKELQLIVPSLQIWLDVENLENVADLEDSITQIDVSLLFLSKGYFSSWNCLREVRHAVFVHSASLCADVAASDINTRRRSLGIPVGGSSIILVRETDEQNHGGLPAAELLGQCPPQIGCKNHIFNLDPDCQGCGIGCEVDFRSILRARADSPGGVIDWIRFKDFKMISLKQIVQQMLVAAQPGGKQELDIKLSIPGELSGTRWEMPRSPSMRVLLHHGCHLSNELPSLLQQAVPGMAVALLNDGGAGEVPQLLADAVGNVHVDERTEVSTKLLVVVHDKCFENARVVKSIEFALIHKISIALLHEADADNQGCTFGSIIGQCPPDLMQISGFAGMKLFGPIAVQWSRGPHQPVSLRLLAKSLGAIAVQQRQCGGCRIAECQRTLGSALASLRARTRSQRDLPLKQGETELTSMGRTSAAAAAASDGWSGFGGPGDAADVEAPHDTVSNPGWTPAGILPTDGGLRESALSVSDAEHAAV
jgi:hypothetical protein